MSLRSMNMIWFACCGCVFGALPCRPLCAGTGNTGAGALRRCPVVQRARPSALRAASAVHVDTGSGLRDDRFADTRAMQLVWLASAARDTRKHGLKCCFRREIHPKQRYYRAESNTDRSHGLCLSGDGEPRCMSEMSAWPPTAAGDI